MTLEGVRLSDITRVIDLDIRTKTQNKMNELIKIIYLSVHGAVSPTLFSSSMKSWRCGAPGILYISDLKAGGFNL